MIFLSTFAVCFAMNRYDVDEEAAIVIVGGISCFCQGVKRKLFSYLSVLFLSWWMCAFICLCLNARIDWNLQRKKQRSHLLLLMRKRNSLWSLLFINMMYITSQVCVTQWIWLIIALLSSDCFVTGRGESEERTMLTFLLSPQMMVWS